MLKNCVLDLQRCVDFLVLLLLLSTLVVNSVVCDALYMHAPEH